MTRAHAAELARVLRPDGKLALSTWDGDGLITGTVRMRALVLAQPKEMQTRIRDAFDRLVRPYATNGGLELPVSVKLASGRSRPGREATTQ